MNAPARPARRGRRQGGSAARRAAVASAAVIHHPEIRRGIPILEVCNQEGVELMHDFAMRVVEEIGCDFQDGESLDYWRQTGAEIDGERVRIGRDELLELIGKIPSSYVHHARNAERTVKVGDGHAVVSPSYGAPFVRDMVGNRRYATLDDLNNLQKLNHMASTIHIAGGTIVEPVDIPVPHRHLHMAYSAFKYSDKPIIGNVTARERAEDTVEMCKLVFGDEFAVNNTCTTSLINANSPLVWDETMLDALKVYALNNHAVMVSPFSMAAASTPASNVGTVGVVLAEALMAMAMTQVVRPGSPMLFGVPAMTVALNSGAPVHGSPDSAMVQLLSNAMARYYQVPHRAILNVATSKSGDMQSAYDSMWGLFPSMLSDANWLTMGGGMLEGALTVGYGKTMIDFEQLDAFYHFLQGPDFSDLDEIFEMTKKVGPGGHFLGETHTLNSNLFIFESQHNNPYEQWDLDGRLDSEQVGVRKAQRWLQKYEAPVIDPAIDEALLDYIARREREIPA
ncbi:MAG: trimethylamine methyltransferase family protein [Gammaproteobacteria bacterium]|nr:trimethylamine methyltransferase family protein [Gammaproteobacteria bacterium]